MKTYTSALILLILLAGQNAFGQWATLKGQFVYGEKGAKVPSASKLVPTKDVQVCGKHQLFDESVVINAENRGIANIYVWVYKHKKGVHPSYDETAKDVIQMDNKGCRFEPHAVMVRAGQTFQVTNSDPVGHNSLINFFKNQSVNPIIPAGGKVDLQLTKAEIMPMKVSCSIHPWMIGLVLVQDHPYMAISDKDGKFEIKNLPVGKHTLRVWHEQSGNIEKVKTDGKKTTWKKGKYILDIKKDLDHVFTVDTSEFKD